MVVINHVYGNPGFGMPINQARWTNWSDIPYYYREINSKNSWKNDQ